MLASRAVACGVACTIFGLGCLPKKSTAPTEAPTEEKTVSAKDGSKTAAGYDKAASLWADAQASNGTDSKSLFKAAQLDRDAAKAARATLEIVAKLKKTYSWTSGLKYKVATGEILGEKEILEALRKIGDDGEAAAQDLEPKLAAAYKTDFKQASSDQIDALTKYGPPDTVEDAPDAAPPDKKAKKAKKAKKTAKPTCWKWSNDKLDASTCWTVAGTVASHEENLKLSDEELAEKKHDEDRAGKQVVHLQMSSFCTLFNKFQPCGEITWADHATEGCLSSGSTLWEAPERFPAKLKLKKGSDILLTVDLAEGDREIELSSDCKISTRHYRPEK